MVPWAPNLNEAGKPKQQVTPMPAVSGGQPENT